MSSNMIDSVLFGNMFGSKRMRDVFSDENMLQKWLDVEGSLAKAEGTLGIIPKASAEEITRKSKVEFIDMEALGKAIIKANHPIMPVVKALQNACDGDHGQYVHWGATTQDIMDTGVSLQLKEAVPFIKEGLTSLTQNLIVLAEKHKNTLMAGRTYGQHALPITFGYKVAIWLEETMRQLTRLERVEETLYVGEMFGAVGTLASLEKEGRKVQDMMFAELGLSVPTVAWHVSRDNLTDLAGVLANISGTLDKIVREVIALQKTEIGELLEPTKKGAVGSSTMPHKRNPMTSSNISALTKLVRNNAAALLNSAVQEHERDLTGWQVEWQALPEMMIYLDYCLEKTTEIVGRLEVNEERMMINANITKGFLLSEKVMLAVGEKIGRQDAHDVVHTSVELANEAAITFTQALLKNEKVMELFSEPEVLELMDLQSYLGTSVEMTEEAIANGKAFLSKRGV